jgi:hypothetical protein
MVDAWLLLKDAARLNYVTNNCILPEVRFAVNWFALRPAIPKRAPADKHIRKDASPFGLCLELG